MRTKPWLAVIGIGSVLSGCSLGVATKESTLAQAGFKKIPSDTPKRVAHMQTIAPNRLIRRTSSDGKTYYVYADPSGCNCIYVGNEAAYASYKGLVSERDAVYAQEERGEEFEGVK